MVRLVVAGAIALVSAWLALLAALLLARRRGGLLREAVSLLPDTVRLLRRLALDRQVARGVRLRLWLLFAYLALPFDLVPDFLPAIGLADDALLVAIVLRSVVRRAGRESLERHWDGTPQGLAALRRLCGLSEEEPSLAARPALGRAGSGSTGDGAS